MKTANSTAPTNMGAKPIVKIAKPCHEKWSDMSTTEKGKFCSMCTKEVVDFTSNTNEEIAAHLKQAEGSVCGRLYTSQVITDTTVSKVKYFFQKSKKYFATLLAVISVSALFGENADAQCRYPIKGKMKIDPLPEQTNANTRETTIRGTVTIAHTKTPAPMAAIQVSSAGQVIERTVTNTNGEYKVQLPPGSIQNQEVSLTTSILGYVDKTIDALKVLKDEITLNFSVEEQFMMMGDMAYIPEIDPIAIGLGEVEIDPEIENNLSNNPSVNKEEIKIIETVPEVHVDILEAEQSAVQHEPIQYHDQIMMLGQMVMIEHEPEVLEALEVSEVEGEIIINDDNTDSGTDISVESPEIIDESQIIPMGFVEMIAPVPHLEITDGPEPIEIEEITNFNPVQQLENKEPLTLVDPLPKEIKQCKMPAPIQRVKKVRKIRKIFANKIDFKEIVLDYQSTQVLASNEADTPTEIPEIFEEISDEGTRETLEPTLESKMIISLYPNPTTDYFTIDLGGEGQFLMQMYDGQGRQIKINKIDRSSSRVSTSTLEPGSYLVRISNAMGDQVETKTIVII